MEKKVEKKEVGKQEVVEVKKEEVKKVELPVQVVELNRNDKPKNRERTYLVFKQDQQNLIFVKEVKARNLRRLTKYLENGEYIVISKAGIKKVIVQ